jgi:hypothetical protein
MRDHLNDTTLANHCGQPIKTSHFLFLNLLENIVLCIFTSPNSISHDLEGCTSTNIGHYIDAKGDDLTQVFLIKKSGSINWWEFMETLNIYW